MNSMIGESNITSDFSLTLDKISDENFDTSNPAKEKFSPPKDTPSTLIKIVSEILSSPCSELFQSPFIFERSIKAATHNTNLILNENGDINKLFLSLKRSFTHYGSELRDYKFLKQLLDKNSKSADFQSIVLKGIDYNLTPLSEQNRIDDIKFHLDRGNHKSAKELEGHAALEKAYNKEVSYGWQIPLLPSAVFFFIKGACITPSGVVKQWFINEKMNELLNVE